MSNEAQKTFHNYKCSLFVISLTATIMKLRCFGVDLIHYRIHFDRFLFNS